jgi:hypothetical protein
MAARAPEVLAPALLFRAVLEGYLLWLRRESGWQPATCSHRVVAVKLLLEEQAEDGLANVPRGAVIHRTELPRVDYRPAQAARRRGVRAVGRYLRYWSVKAKRLVEVLERDEQSLSRLLDGLDAIEADHADRDELDLRDLAKDDEEGA